MGGVIDPLSTMTSGSSIWINCVGLKSCLTIEKTKKAMERKSQRKRTLTRNRTPRRRKDPAGRKGGETMLRYYTPDTFISLEGRIVYPMPQIISTHSIVVCSTP